MIVFKGVVGIEANIGTANDSFFSLVISGLNFQKKPQNKIASIISNILSFPIDDPN